MYNAVHTILRSTSVLWMRACGWSEYATRSYWLAFYLWFFGIQDLIHLYLQLRTDIYKLYTLRSTLVRTRFGCVSQREILN